MKARAHSISLPRPVRHVETDEILGLISGVIATTSDVTAEQQLTRAEIYVEIFDEISTQYQREFERVKAAIGEDVANALLPQYLG